MNVRSIALPNPGLARRDLLSRVLFTAVLGLAAMLGGCSKYNELVEKDQVAEQRWADVHANLQRRHDLIPNLVSTVRASARHEQQTLTAVVEARARATSIQIRPEDTQDPQKMAQLQAAEGELGRAISRLMMVQEAYPELRANQAFHDLQVQLEGTENRILRAREQYNAAVRDYNAELNKIGGSVVNRATGRNFRARVYFTTTADAQRAPEVNL